MVLGLKKTKAAISDAGRTVSAVAVISVVALALALVALVLAVTPWRP